ncbi:MAG: putative selenate ABC transporter substrate-binding protein [Planctomycetota bacterium]|jgi:phosphonate transport system substrate-binding protein|nr:putative selenate ABC transporter substrate-binding protein [Planctomycetota bacterium]
MRHLVPLILLFASSCSKPEDSTNVFRFTAIPDTNSSELELKFKPVAAYLTDKLGVPVEYIATSDYSASVEMFKNGDVQLAWFGGLSGAQARAAVDGAQAIAQGVEDPNFKTYFVAHNSTKIEKSKAFPKALQGLSFTFGSATSTSGRLMPEHFVSEYTGRTPAEFFGNENAFSGSHDKTAKLVEAGTFKAGALNYITYDRMVAEGKLDPEVCKVVWETPTYPDYNWTVHGNVDSEMVNKIQQALLDMKDPELLKAIDRPNGLIKATNADFAPIHELAQQLNFL